MRLAILADEGFRLGIAQVLDALLRTEVELDPMAFVGRIDEAEGVRTKAVHVAIGGRQAALTHDDGDLMQRLRQRGPEVPVVLRRTHVGARVALHRVVEVGELERIAQEEHRRVVADQVPVAFFSVELDGKAADVALGIGGAAFTGNGGEAREQFGLLADLAEDLRPRVFADVVSHGEGTVGTGTLGMHAPLRDHFAVEVGQLLEQPDILHQHRAAWAGGHRVLVVDHRAAGGGGEFFLVHVALLTAVGNRYGKTSVSFGDQRQDFDPQPIQHKSIPLHGKPAFISGWMAGS